MKIHPLKILMLLAVLAGIFSSCKDKEVTLNITLQYQKCECEHEAAYIKKIERKNILLLDAEKVTMEDIAEYPYPREYVICSFKLKGSHYTQKPDPLWNYSGVLCNFPFDSFGDIPKEGIYISFAGDVYEKCNFKGGIPENFYSDIVLTSLKIETK